MPRAGSKRWSKNKTPRRIRSKPLKAELRSWGASLKRTSSGDVAFPRGDRLGQHDNSGDDEEQRPEIADPEARVLSGEKNRAQCDQHQRAHQTGDAAMRAVAFYFRNIGHGMFSYEFVLPRRC